MVEIGDTGVAFKKEGRGRYLSVDETRFDIEKACGLKEGSIFLVAVEGARIVACIKGVVINEENDEFTLHVGPFAVSPLF